MCETHIGEGGLDRATFDFGGYYGGDLLSAVGNGQTRVPRDREAKWNRKSWQQRVQNMLFGFFDDVVGQSTGVGPAM